MENKKKILPFDKSSNIQSKHRRNKGSIDIVWHVISKRGFIEGCVNIYIDKMKKRKQNMNSSKI